MIQDGDFIILKKESSMRIVQAKKNGRPFIFDKVKFYLNNIFGKPYGTQFEVEKKSNQLVPRTGDFSIADALPEASSGLDNRNLLSANDDNQNLGKEEIQALRKDGLTGDEVMTELIKNSATFTQKTKFSQEKWIKKKKKKHMNVYTVLRPCIRLIADMYYQRDPAKISFLRMDSLAQILTMSNIQANSKVLLVESCQGLLAGAIFDRLSDNGCLTQLFTGPNPMKGRSAFDDCGFPKDLAKSRMKLFPLNRLHELTMFVKTKVTSETAVAPDKRQKMGDARASLSSSGVETIHSSSASHDPDNLLNEAAEPVHQQTGEPTNPSQSATSRQLSDVKDDISADSVKSSDVAKEDKTNRGEKRELDTEVKQAPHLMERLAAKEFIESNKFDTLVIAVKVQPTQLVLRLIDLIKLSRPFVVFHPHKEPLMEVFVELKERGGIVNLRLSETWYRPIQVLPERTHPMVNMSGASGYILTGTVVDRT